MRFPRLIALLLGLLLARPAAAQLTDSFADGDFTQSPAWSGDVGDFQVNATQQLQSNGAAVAATKVLATPSRVSGAARWEFWANLKFGTSANNLADVFLMSDSLNLNGRNSGYFVRLGGTPDEVSLFRKDGAATPVYVVDGADGLLASTSNNLVRVRVTRTNRGQWTLEADPAGGTTWQVQGSARDTTYAASRWFGVVARYTASNNTKFYFDDFRIADTAPPTIRALTVVNGTTLRVQFDEVIANAPAVLRTNYSVSGLGPPLTVAVDPLDEATVTLTFSGTFGAGPQTLTVNYAEDLYGNGTPQRLTRQFIFATPPPVAAFGDVRINELYVDTNPLVGLPAAVGVEVLNVSNKTFDLAGWKLQDATTTQGTLAAGALAPNQYAVLCRAADTTIWRTALGPTVRIVGITTMPTLNVTGDLVRLFSPTGLLIDRVNYTTAWYRDAAKAQGGWSIEQINPRKPCSDADNWIASTDVTGGTPGRQNSVFNGAADVTAPAIATTLIATPTRIDLTFTEAIDTLVMTPASFTLTGGLSVTAVRFRPDTLKTVTLTLSGPLVPGTYVLTANGARDCSGNTGSPAPAVTILIPFPATAGDVRLNELYIDTNPTVGLPAAQGVEVLNVSNKTFDLSGWKLQDATTTQGTLAAGRLNPGQYAVLCRATDTTTWRTALGANVRIVGVTSWPTFNLTGDLVRLFSPTGVLIDRVNYTDDWYRDAIKKQGGWSIEQINPQRQCSDADNWIASNDVTGGTPGRQNSVFNGGTDVTAPALVSATIRTPTRVDLTFSEAIDTLAAGTAAFTLTGGLTITAVRFRADTLKTVTLTLSGPLGAGTSYTLTATGIRDCAGNIATPPLTTTLLLGAAAAIGDVRVNEIYVDTNPVVGLPAAPFVEVLNVSNKTFDLTGWKLQDATTTQGTLGAGRLAPGQYAVLCRTTDTTAYRAFLGPNVRLVGITTMPSLNVTGDLVRLFSPAGVLIDRVNYTDDWYRDAVKKQGGWSIEQINPLRQCSDADNWIASNNLIGGTPGRQNSVFNGSADVTAPAIVTAVAVTPTRVDLTFSEAIDTLAAGTSAFTLTGGLTVTAVRFRTDTLKTVTLTLSGPLVAGTSYTLTATGIRDCAGNIATPPLTTTLLLGAVAAFGDVRVNEIYVDTNPVVGLPAAVFIEVYNSSTQTFDLTGWQIQDNTTSLGTLGFGRLAPGQYAILCRTADTTTYRTALGANVRIVGVTSLPSFNLSGDAVKLFSPAGLLINQVNYTDDWYRDAVKAQGGWSIEQINPLRQCSDAANWIASNDVTGGTPGRQNSVFNTAPDNTAPAVAGVQVLAPTTIRISFTEAIDTLSAGTGAFGLNLGLSVTATRFRADSLRYVWLTLNGPLVPGTRYNLTVSGIRDCAGNTLSPAVTVAIVRSAVAVTGDVRLNELYVDTNPVVGLPAAPFVEVYNVSTKLFDLAGWQIQDAAGSSGTLGAGLLAPGQYAVLCRTTDTTTYRTALGAGVRIIGIDGLPSLNLTGDLVRLLNPSGTRIDQVTYNDDWYRDAAKKNGGWSLEQINPLKDCADADNWIASNDISGGTPGRQNSVFNTAPDNTAPALVGAVAVTSTRIDVTFSEAIDTLSAGTAAFGLTGGLTVTAVRFRPDSLRVVTLTLGSPLVVGIRYTLTVTGVRDCAGNTRAQPLTTTLGLGDLPGLYELEITEIMADETPQVGLPASEYLEIYNATTRVLTLDGVRLRKQGASGSPATFPAGSTLGPNEYAIVCGSTRGSLFTPYGKVFALTNFPTLSSSGDTLVLRRPDGQLLFSVAYTDDWYRDDTKKDGGWALEMIDVTRPCGGAENWAASTDAAAGGTPGRRNSVAAALPDQQPPAIERATVLHATLLRMRFTEKLDSARAADLSHYAIASGPAVTAVTVLGPEFREVMVRLATALPIGQFITLSATGLTDCAGNQASQPLTIRVLVPETPQPGDVVINEILFNPRPGGYDFVEVINRSTRQLDLRGWLLANVRGDSLYQVRPVSRDSYPLSPGQLVALTVEPDSVVRQYPNSSDLNRMLRLASFPSYPDDAGTVVLLAPDSSAIDRYTYDDSQHTPLLTNDDGVSLERVRRDGPSEPSNFYSAAATAGYATPGKPNSQSRPDAELPDNMLQIEPRVITPDGDGTADFADIRYAVPGAGYTANLTVFDSQGRLTRRLARNQTLSLTGTFQWDGITDDNRRAPVGYYVVFAEFFDVNGTVKVHKQTVAVGVR